MTLSWPLTWSDWSISACMNCWSVLQCHFQSKVGFDRAKSHHFGLKTSSRLHKTVLSCNFSLITWSWQTILQSQNKVTQNSILQGVHGVSGNAVKNLQELLLMDLHTFEEKVWTHLLQLTLVCVNYYSVLFMRFNGLSCDCINIIACV